MPPAPAPGAPAPGAPTPDAPTPDAAPHDPAPHDAAAASGGAGDAPRPSRLLLAALALGLLASVVLALLPGEDALFPALVALGRDVTAHDGETLRREHDGWYARLLPVYSAIEASQLAPDEPLLLVTEGIPPWFVAARFPSLRVFASSPELRAELDAERRPYHVLTLTNAEPLRWTLLPGDAAPR